jgi:thiol:disulfide interchange protein
MGETNLVLHLFYSSACVSCHEAINEINKVKKTYPQLDIQYHNLIYPDSEKLKQAFCSYYNVPAAERLEFPAAFLGNQYLREPQLKQKYIENVIKSLQEASVGTPSVETVLSSGTNNNNQNFSKINVMVIIIAGLIDGVNPCAFLTLTFLVSLLYTQHSSRRRIALMGTFYTAGVFLTYLAIGFGLSGLIGVMEQFSWLLSVVQLIIGMAAILFGLMSFRDFLAMRKNNYKEVSLKLPDQVKGLIRSSLKKGTTSVLLPLGAFGAGFIVSVLEFMCTGQIYLPTLIYMRTVTAFQNQAYFLLVLYNLAFIVPLVILFVIALIGTSSFKLLKFGGKLYPIAKIALSLVFIVLGLFLINEVAQVILSY